MSLFTALKSYSKKLTWLVFAIVLFSITSLATAPHAKAADSCDWYADSNITCGTGDFFFHLEDSVSQGKMVYKERVNGEWKDNYFYPGEAGNNGTKVIGGVSNEVNLNLNDRRDFRAFGKLVNDKMDGWDLSGSWFQDLGPKGSYPEKGTDVYFACGLESKAGEICFSGKDGNRKDITDAQATVILKLKEDLKAGIESLESCDDSGSLSFVFCPLLKSSRDAVKSLIGSDGSGKGFLIQLLTITPLENSSGSRVVPPGCPGGPAGPLAPGANCASGNTNTIYEVWKVVRDISLGMFILIFVVIIFGNGLGMDSYTIKRALPRLAAGVLLTFASFFIVQTLVDISNALGNAIPAIIGSIAQNTNLVNYQIDLNFGGQYLAVGLLILFTLAALVALLVGIAGLIFRQIVIFGLVLTAPLAFAAWVLPNTESLFKKWWKNLIKVLAMFPIVTGMLALALLFQSTILGAAGGSGESTPLQLAGTIAPLFAIAMIPKTFKWGGEAFALGAGYLAGKATGAIDRGKGEGKTRLGNSMKSGMGATALNKIGQDSDGNLRPGLSRVPGIGSPISKRKAAVRMGERQATITKRYKDGLDNINDGNLANIYSSMSPRARKGGYGSAVKSELGKRRSGAIEDYAKSVRDGRDTTFLTDTKLPALDKALDDGGNEVTIAGGAKEKHKANTARVLAAVDARVAANNSNPAQPGTTTTPLSPTVPVMPAAPPPPPRPTTPRYTTPPAVPVPPPPATPQPTYQNPKTPPPYRGPNPPTPGP